MKRPAITFRIEPDLAKYIEELTSLMAQEKDSWNLSRSVSKSRVVCELLRIGIEVHRKRKGQFND